MNRAGLLDFSPLLRDDQSSLLNANLAPPIGSLNSVLAITILLNVFIKAPLIQALT
jgi:hypothetical protein